MSNNKNKKLPVCAEVVIEICSILSDKAKGRLGGDTLNHYAHKILFVILQPELVLNEDTEFFTYLQYVHAGLEVKGYNMKELRALMQELKKKENRGNYENFWNMLSRLIKESLPFSKQKKTVAGTC